MADPLNSIRALVHSPADAIRWACVLEATAPKAGNVYPGRDFNNLTYQNFLEAAEFAAQRIGNSRIAISQRMLAAVEETVLHTNTNVNLGIVLLLGPLVAADEAMLACERAVNATRQADEDRLVRNDRRWLDAIAVVLENLTLLDGENIFLAINRASAGGLGKVEQMDVNDSLGPVDVIAAMQQASQRDRIARQYATNYGDLINNVIPVLWNAIDHCGDLLLGIARAHLQLLAAEPDSLIARKNGQTIAESVQKRAQKVDLDDVESIAKFDATLRSNAHKLNPGTTADLIAAALYVLLRTPS